jgi:arsenical-resistance protein 2
MTQPWYTNFPTPISSPASITHEALAALMKNPDHTAGKDYLVIDVRRTDFGVPYSYHRANVSRI